MVSTAVWLGETSSLRTTLILSVYPKSTPRCDPGTLPGVWVHWYRPEKIKFGGSDHACS
jgi:hypothetical protein